MKSCLIKSKPQQTDVFYLYGKVEELIILMNPTGPGIFTTSGKLRASAASYPEAVSISETTI